MRVRFPDHPEVADIRKGNGYADLITDLGRLIDMYQSHAEELAGDGRWYDPADAQGASTLIEELVGALTGDDRDEYRRWVDMQVRAFTALRKDYDLLRSLAEFLWRDVPEVAGRFPPLGTASRKSRSRTEAPSAEPVPTVGEEATVA